MSRAADDAAERRERAEADALAAFDAVCPGILGNRFIPHFPFPKQALFLGGHQHRSGGAEVYEALYGGAAGGGKSDALLMALAQYVHDPSYAAAAFRRTVPDLKNPGSILDRAMEWWIPRGVAWNGTQSVFTFPSGAKVKFGHMSAPEAHLDHQGAEYQTVVWDELTQHPKPRQYDYLKTRLRTTHGSKLPLRSLSASNPGGPGHAWVKARCFGARDPSSGRWIPPTFAYWPARIADNPALDQRRYIATLSVIANPTLVAQLMLGDWDARMPGDYYRREWFGPLLTEMWIDSDCRRVRWWDLASSTADDAAHTVGVRMARHVAGVRAIEHCVSFRATPGTRDGLIVQTAQSDGFGVTVGLEIEGGSGGQAQFDALERRLHRLGYHVVGNRPTNLPNASDVAMRSIVLANTSDRAKILRAVPVSSCLERGYRRRGEGEPDGIADDIWGVDRGVPVELQRDGIRMVAGPWTAHLLDMIEGFPEGGGLDESDAISGAYSYLEAYPPGMSAPPAVPDAVPRSALEAELDEDGDDDWRVQAGIVDSAGRWLPP